MSDLLDLQLLRIAEKLIGYRFDLAGVILDLGKAEEESPEAELCAILECAVIDHFDPLLRNLLNAAGGPRSSLLEAALDLAGIRHRLQSLCATLPDSPDEDAMLDGEIPTDVPTEMKTTIVAVVEDQLSLAYENLLHAARYNAPEPAPETGEGAKAA